MSLSVLSDGLESVSKFFAPQGLTIKIPYCRAFFDHTDLVRRHCHSLKVRFRLKRATGTVGIDALADHVVFEGLRESVKHPKKRTIIHVEPSVYIRMTSKTG